MRGDCRVRTLWLYSNARELHDYLLYVHGCAEDVDVNAGVYTSSIAQQAPLRPPARAPQKILMHEP
jgi:hypothetical protein